MPLGYRTDIATMIEVRQTDVFRKWFKKLQDRRARVRIQARLDRVALGHFGDARPVGEGISELRIHYGPGYRIYFAKVDSLVVVLLSGGDKSSQSTDIKRAKEIAKNL